MAETGTTRPPLQCAAAGHESQRPGSKWQLLPEATSLASEGGRGPQLVFGVVSPGGARSQLVLSPAWAQLTGQRVERLREWRRPSRALELWASGSEVVPMMWQQKQDTEVPEQN